MKTNVLKTKIFLESFIENQNIFKPRENIYLQGELCPQE